MIVTLVVGISVLCLLLDMSRTLKSCKCIGRLKSAMDITESNNKVVPTIITIYVFLVCNAHYVVNLCLMAPAHWIWRSTESWAAVISSMVKTFAVSACGGCAIFAAALDTNACLQWDLAQLDLLRIGVSWSSLFGVLQCGLAGLLRNRTQPTVLCMPTYGEDTRTKGAIIAEFALNVALITAASAVAIWRLCTSNKVASRAESPLATMQECVPPGRSVSAIISNSHHINEPPSTVEIAHMHRCCVLKMILIFLTISTVNMIIELWAPQDDMDAVVVYQTIRECVTCILLVAFYEQYRPTAEAILTRMRSCPVTTHGERRTHGRQHKDQMNPALRASAHILQSREGSLSVCQSPTSRSPPRSVSMLSITPPRAADPPQQKQMLSVPDEKHPSPREMNNSFHGGNSQSSAGKFMKMLSAGHSPLASAGASLMKLPGTLTKGAKVNSPTVTPSINIPNILVDDDHVTAADGRSSRDNLSSVHSLQERLSRCVSSLDVDSNMRTIAHTPREQDVDEIIRKQQAAVLMDPLKLNAKLTQYINTHCKPEPHHGGTPKNAMDLIVESVEGPTPRENLAL